MKRLIAATLLVSLAACGDGSAPGWERHWSVTDKSLKAAVATAPGEVLVVGEGSESLSYAGGEWSKAIIPGALDPERLSAAAPNEIWAIEPRSSAVGFWNGAAWESRTVPGVTEIEDVHARAVDDVWVLGSVVRHWNGASWQTVLEANDVPYDGERIFAAAPDQVWLIKEPPFLRYDGTAWRSVSAPSIDFLDKALAVQMTAPNDVWVLFGQSFSDGARLVRWNGTEWKSDVSPLLATISPRTLYVRSATEAWLGGKSGHLLKWNGASWSEVLPKGDYGVADIQGIAPAGSAQLWLVGSDGLLLHHDPTRVE